MTRDEGQALVEGLLLSLLLLVPTLWTLGVLSDLHRGALATTAAARAAGFDAARSSNATEASAAVKDAVARAFVDHGLDPDDAEVAVSLSGLEREETVEVRIEYSVTVFQAPLLGRVGGPSIPVSAVHVTTIDPYRSRE